MNRRRFLQTTASSLFLPTGIAAANAAVREPDMKAAGRCFYDERFVQARRLAGELSGSAPATPVRGDVTDVWNAGLKRACLESALTLRGVTTESFYFCLDVLLRSHANVTSRVTRINRDLYLWTIRSNIKPITGRPT